MVSGYSSAVLSASTLRSSLRSLACALAISSSLGVAGCGGSSSETPPPLEPLPANLHYNRSATTLPGELGASVRPAGEASAKKAEPKAAPAASGR
jgi:hypothetical protein